MAISDHARRLAHQQGRRDSRRLGKLLYLQAALFKACPYLWESELASEWRRGVEEQRGAANTDDGTDTNAR